MRMVRQPRKSDYNAKVMAKNMNNYEIHKHCRLGFTCSPYRGIDTDEQTIRADKKPQLQANTVLTSVGAQRRLHVIKVPLET